MRKKNRLPYLCLFGVLLILMSRPKATVEHLQGMIVAAFAPVWKWETNTKSDNADLQRLQIENQLLKNEVNRNQELLKEAFYLKKELQQFYSPGNAVQGRLKELAHLLKRRLEAVPARVIFRASGTWNNFLWLDVGSSTNETLGLQVVAKNSPVVVGNSLVGVIDYVGKNQARVRLITDGELFPAVRSVRGHPQAMRLVETINMLLDNLNEQESLFATTQEKEALFLQLEKLQSALTRSQETLYLAKGELQGCCAPHKRSHGNLLKGIGFNFDYADTKGPSRDLRTGIPNEAKEMPSEPTPLLKVHDILATTGMDGIFPEGLQVAEIVNVEPLEEGSYYYELQARPTAGNLDSLSLVFVMAPQSFDTDDENRSMMVLE